MPRQSFEKVNAEKVFLKVHGVDREIKFSFSAWAILEKEYDGLKNLAKLQKEVEERPFNTLPHLLYVGLVDKSPIVNGEEVFEITEENILNDVMLEDLEKAAVFLPFFLLSDSAKPVYFLFCL